MSIHFKSDDFRARRSGARRPERGGRRLAPIPVLLVLIASGVLIALAPSQREPSRDGQSPHPVTVIEDWHGNVARSTPR